jgi:hypothetical protein
VFNPFFEELPLDVPITSSMFSIALVEPWLVTFPFLSFQTHTFPDVKFFAFFTYDLITKFLKSKNTKMSSF